MNPNTDKYCQHCGAIIPKTAIYCQFCGAKQEMGASQQMSSKPDTQVAPDNHQLNNHNQQPASVTKQSFGFYWYQFVSNLFNFHGCSDVHGFRDVMFPIWIAVFILALLFGKSIAGLIMLLVFIFTLGLNIRRLHDAGNRGWWILLQFLFGIFYVIVLASFHSDNRKNKKYKQEAMHKGYAPMV